MFDPSAPHIIILLIVVLLLFGSRRLPGAARALGQSMHIFKKSVSGLDTDEDIHGTAANPSVFPTRSEPALPPLTGDATQQLQDLQRQVEELQRQSAGGGTRPDPGLPR